MTNRTARILAISAMLLAMTYIVTSRAIAFKYRDATIASSSFRVHNPMEVASELHLELDKLVTSTFPGKRATDTDNATLKSYVDTLQAQARFERWTEAEIKVTTAGKQSPAGYSIKYSAKTASGKKVNGGGTIVVDRLATYAFIKSLDDARVGN